MDKIIIKGVKEDGTFDTEVQTTAMLVTKLIDKFPHMCEGDIQHELEDIRKSAEMDARIRRNYAFLLKQRNGLSPKKEKRLIDGGIEAVTSCVSKHHDMDSAVKILNLCKAIAGERFHVHIVPDKEDDLKQSTNPYFSQ